VNYPQGAAKVEFWNILDKFWKKRKLPKEGNETRIRIGKELEAVSWAQGPSISYIFYIFSTI